MAEEVFRHARHVTSPSVRRTLQETYVRDIAPQRELVFSYDTDGIVVAFKARITYILKKYSTNDHYIDIGFD